MWWPFIEGRRGQAGWPAWRRAAPPAALLAPRQSLSRSFAGMSAPVGDDGTRANEGYLAALMRPASLSPPVKGVGLLPLLLMHSEHLILAACLTKGERVGPAGLHFGRVFLCNNSLCKTNDLKMFDSKF